MEEPTKEQSEQKEVRQDRNVQEKKHNELVKKAFLLIAGKLDITNDPDADEIRLIRLDILSGRKY